MNTPDPVTPDPLPRTVRDQLVDGIGRFERGRVRRRIAVVGVVIVVALVGGAVLWAGDDATAPDVATDGDEPSPSTVPGTAPAPSSTLAPPTSGSVPIDVPVFPTCDTVPAIEAPADWYRDTPVYVVNEQPREPVLAWAETKPDFEQMWIDRDHLGWLTVGFSGPVDEYQRELEEMFPDVGVVAVTVPYTQAELDALRERVRPLLEGNLDSWGMGGSVHTGVVTVSLGVLLPERLALLAPLEGEPICVEGAPAEAAVTPGPQPTGGEGWRLLADELIGPNYRTGVATNEAQYETLWRSIGLIGDRPAVDFETEIVIWFGAVYGSNCPIRLDDVVVDDDAGLVHAHTVQPGNEALCNSDANSHAFVVALERARLPEGPFMVQLRATEPPRGVPEERTLVAVDLSAPGSEAAIDEIGFDPSLVDRGPGSLAETYPFPGEPVVWDLTLVCPGYVGDVWDFSWTNDDTAWPSEWLAEADGGVLRVEIVLDVDPPVLTVTAGGVSREYFPVALGDNCVS